MIMCFIPTTTSEWNETNKNMSGFSIFEDEQMKIKITLNETSLLLKI